MKPYMFWNKKPEHVQILELARAKLTPAGSWCQNAVSDGRALCVLGAIGEAARELGRCRHGARHAAVRALMVTIGTNAVAFWNDNRHRTHADVLRALDDTLIRESVAA